MKPWVMKVLPVLIGLLEDMRPQLYTVVKKMFPGLSFGIKGSSVYVGKYHIWIVPASEEGEFAIRFFSGDHEYAFLYTTIELDLFGNYKERDLKRVILDSLKTLHSLTKKESYLRSFKNMKKFTIKEETRIPGTNIVLEKKDQILYSTKKLRESKRSEVEKILRYYDFEDQGLDTWDNYEGTEVILGEDDDSLYINTEGKGKNVSFSKFLRNPEMYLFPDED